MLLLAPQTFAGPWIKSLPEAQKKAKAGNRLIFVDMFADWCGWCHRMEQEVFPAQAFQKATDDMVLLRLNTEDGADGTRFAQDFGITSLPTFVLLTHDGMIAGMIRGYAPAPEFVKTLGETRAKWADFNKRVANEAALAKDYQKRYDLAREFTQHYGLKQSETRFRKLVTEKDVPPSIRDQAYYELSVSQFLQKRYDDAIATAAAFAKVQSKGEPFERSRVLVGQAWMQKGNYLAAANELRSFKLKFPNSSLIGTVNMMLPGLEARLAR
jgi:thioredoxin-related protein